MRFGSYLENCQLLSHHNSILWTITLKCILVSNPCNQHNTNIATLSSNMFPGSPTPHPQCSPLPIYYHQKLNICHQISPVEEEAYSGITMQPYRQVGLIIEEKYFIVSVH